MTSQESEMVTYKHVTEVVKDMCVNNLAKRVDSTAILLPIELSFWGFNNLNI